MPKRTAPPATFTTTSTKRAKPTTTSASTLKSQDTSSSAPERKTDDDGAAYWELSSNGMRRATVNEFKGVKMVSVREYYVDKGTGGVRPGSKGISLSLDQYSALLQILPQIEAVLVKDGHAVPRPQYDGAVAENGVVDDADEEKAEKDEEEEAEGVDEEADEAEQEEPVPAPATKPQKAAKLVKPAKKVKAGEEEEAVEKEEDEEIPAGNASSKLAKFKYS